MDVTDGELVSGRASIHERGVYCRRCVRVVRLRLFSKPVGQCMAGYSGEHDAIIGCDIRRCHCRTWMCSTMSSDNGRRALVVWADPCRV